jgi:hypothetical protein
MKTPYTEDINFEVNHDGTKNNFKSSSEISYGYKKVSGQLTTDRNDANGVLMDKDDFMISSAECVASTVIFCWSIPVSK